jgi:hypothetical protein
VTANRVSMPATRVARHSVKDGKPQESKVKTLFLVACVSLTVFASPGEQPNAIKAARSVHLGYPAPEGLYFYNELVVEQSVNGSYFMACGWNTGYFGIQQLGSSDDKIVLFSVWDPTKGDDANAVKSEDRVEVPYEGEGVRIKRFGGEGTGGQCLWEYHWHLGQTNRFLIGAEVEGQKTSYTAWIYATNVWKQLATFRTRTRGMPLRGYYSFIEDFRRDGASARQERRARFGKGWVQTTDRRWVPLSQARFTASNADWESKTNINVGAQGIWFSLATGGDVNRTLDLGSLINLPAPSTPAPKPPGRQPSEVKSGSGLPRGRRVP